MNGHKKNSNAGNQLLVETLMVIVITTLLFLTFKNFNSIIPILPAIYLLIEKRKRHRTWSDIGFKTKNFFGDLKNNWYLILLIGIFSPLSIFLIGKYCVPGYIHHLKSRLPLNINVIIPTIITITIGTFLEEIIFRGFVQGRLEWFISPVKSIIITSLLFAFMHYSDGSIAVVALDILGIFIDSILYGVIFTKTKNIFTSWVTHYLSDVIGILCLLFI